MKSELAGITARVANSGLNRIGRNLFRDTSYPESPPTPEIPPDASLTLYIHIPFCEAPLCTMCPFFRQVYERDTADTYMADLRAELGHYKDYDFSSVYIGGGTPVTVLDELVSLIDDFGLNSQELSIEAHPRDLTEDNVERMREAGVNRVSVGVQSFDEEMLKQMGRTNGPDAVEHLARAQEVLVVNADLIYNIEGQAIDEFEQEMDILIEMGISQITCYPLMPSPGKFVEVDDSQEELFYKAMLNKFDGTGYVALTPWCFTKYPKESQGEYISNVTSDGQYVGVGASAIGKIGRLFRINTFNLSEYHDRVTRGFSITVGSRQLTTFEDAQYYLLTNLFGMKLDLNNLPIDRFQNSLIRTELRVLQMFGIVCRDGDVVNVTENGMYYLSRAMKEFYTGLNFYRKKHKEDAAHLGK